jgi:peptidoglycan/xylan/chitin deacetylase (PgdA/CDA1 family)
MNLRPAQQPLALTTTRPPDTCSPSGAAFLSAILVGFFVVASALDVQSSKAPERVSGDGGSLLRGTAEPLPEKVVVLTFDDAARTHFTLVRPILKKLGFSATFFITEGFDFPRNKRDYMSWKQIAELHHDGFEIGNHTRDHRDLTPRTVTLLAQQIESINEKLAKNGIPRPVSFAYAGNAVHLDALPILEDAGFKFARRGGSPEYPYDGGWGVAYEPGRDHPLLIPSAADARPTWTLGDFKTALARASSIVNASRPRSRLQPRWVSWPRMVFLQSRTHTCMRSRNFSRPSSWRVRFSARSCFSMTFWVAMPP